MLDQQLRSKGIGGSEVAAILGMDPRRDAFAVWAQKTGRVPPAPPNPRMQWGKRLEQVIADAYAVETKQYAEWCDETRSNSSRLWQLGTPDAFVFRYGVKPFSADLPLGGLDCKNVAWDRSHEWGERGSEDVPQPIALQLQWYASTFDLPWWDAAALFGGNDLRIFRIHRDPQIEAILLAEAERFWKENVLANVAPKPGPSPATVEALKAMFPKNTEALRVATAEEQEIIAKLRTAKAAEKIAKDALTALQNTIKLAIGQAEGLTFGGLKDKVTYKRCKDTMGTGWRDVARAFARDVVGATAPESAVEELLAEAAKQHQVVTREGSRRLLCPRSWGDEDE